MLHDALTRFLGLVARTFFKRIDAVGLGNIPDHGAVIFAGNHPNALIDGLVLISQVQRGPVHFLSNAKLWKVPLLSHLLDALGAVPVFRREEHGPGADNQNAFERVHETLAAEECVAIFPEGVSHAGSELTTLKTGVARMALYALAKRGTPVAIVPFGLTYMNRHRFRSQVLVQFGKPILVNDPRLPAFHADEYQTVRQLTEELRTQLTKVTLNAPDWDTLRFIHSARRLYKPSASELTPENYVELSRRFVDHYTMFADEPEVQRLRNRIEDYQAQLDLLGLKDHQLSHPVDAATAMKRITWRTFLIILLLPLAVPGALILLPVAWLAATVSAWFSDDVDDIATLKVGTAVLLLLSVYFCLAVAVGVGFGSGWSVVALFFLPLSFFATLVVLEKQAQLLASVLSVFRLARLGSDIENIKARRQDLVRAVRTAADDYADPALRRIFDAGDFRSV